MNSKDLQLTLFGVTYGIAGQMLWNAFAFYIQTFWGKYLPLESIQLIGGIIVVGLFIYTIRMINLQETRIDPFQKKLESFP